MLAFSMILLFTQCEQETEDTRTLITKKIQYDVPVVNVDASYDWWIENIEGTDREALLNNIFERVLAGDIQAYDYFNKPLSVKQVNSIMADTIAQTLMRSTEPYEEYDTIIIHNIEYTDVEIIRFLEEWKYDEESLKIDKKIIGICPVIKVLVGEEILTRPLFWVYFDEIK